jgi:hypothetical protein
MAMLHQPHSSSGYCISRRMELWVLTFHIPMWWVQHLLQTTKMRKAGNQRGGGLATAYLLANKNEIKYCYFCYYWNTDSGIRMRALSTIPSSIGEKK